MRVVALTMHIIPNIDMGLYARQGLRGECVISRLSRRKEKWRAWSNPHPRRNNRVVFIMYSKRVIWVAPEKLVYKQMLLPFCFVPSWPFDDYVDMVAGISRRDTS